MSRKPQRAASPLPCEAVHTDTAACQERPRGARVEGQTLGRLRCVDCERVASVGFTVRPRLEGPGLGVHSCGLDPSGTEAERERLSTGGHTAPQWGSCRLRGQLSQPPPTDAPAWSAQLPGPIVAFPCHTSVSRTRHKQVLFPSDRTCGEALEPMLTALWSLGSAVWRRPTSGGSDWAKVSASTPWVHAGLPGVLSFPVLSCIYVVAMHTCLPGCFVTLIGFVNCPRGRSLCVSGGVLPHVSGGEGSLRVSGSILLPQRLGVQTPERVSVWELRVVCVPDWRKPGLRAEEQA